MKKKLRSVALAGPHPKAGIGGVRTVHENVRDILKEVPGLRILDLDKGHSAEQRFLPKLCERIIAAIACRKQAGEADILHVQFNQASVLTDTLWTAVAGLGKTRIVAHMHCHKDALQTASSAQKLGWKLLSKLVDALFVLSDDIAEQFRGFPCAVYTVPNFVDTSLYLPTEKKEKTVLFCARMCSDKGIWELLDTGDFLEEKGWNIRYAGSFSEEEEEKRFSSSVAALNNVTWTGPLEGEALRKEYLRSAVFILPTRKDLFPLSLLEAGAARCAVVTTDKGIITSIVRNGIDGVIAEDCTSDDLKKALDKVTGSDKLREEMSEEFHNRVVRYFSAEAVQKLLLNLYGKILSTE